MPYLPLLYGIVFKITGTLHHALIARLLTYLFWLATLCLVHAVSRLLRASRLLSLSAAVLCGANPFMLRATAEASNYVLPAMLSLVQLATLLIGIQCTNSSRRRALVLLASGAAAGLAVGTKLYYVVPSGVMLFMPLILGQRSWRNRTIDCTCLVAGFLIAIAPVLVFVAASPRVFWFDNISFHRLTSTLFRGLPDFTTAPVHLADKLKFVNRIFLLNAEAIIALMLLSIAITWRAGRRPMPMQISIASTLAMCFALSLCVAVWMTPSWFQYYAMPVPFLVLLMVAAYEFAPPGERKTLELVAMAVAVTSSVLAFNPQDFVSAITLNWSSLQIESASREIRDAMASAGVQGKVATLQPFHATEAGLPIYSELATGPFLFGVSDHLSPEQRKTVVAVGPGTIEDLFHADPPAAILAGFYLPGGLYTDESLANYAVSHEYVARPLKCCDDAMLYLRTSNSGAKAGLNQAYIPP